VEVSASGRGAATLTRRTRLTLPAEPVGEVADVVVAAARRDETAA
jgi:hypothetical protein